VTDALSPGVPPDEWRNNEDGPRCECGNPTVVKLLPDGTAIFLCLFHAQGEGLYRKLPAQRPAEWTAASD
jgi:hypothetical protein